MADSATPFQRAPREDRRPSRRVTGGLLVVATLGLGAGTGAVATDSPPALEATTPERYWDSREMFGGDKNPPGGKIGVITSGIPDMDVSDPIPDDAEAVFVNVTAVEAEAPGFVSVVTGAVERFDIDFVPETSNLNVDTPGQTIANSAIIPLGDIDYGTNDAGEFGVLPTVIVHSSMVTHILVDVLGYVPAGSDYTSIPLQRALDTRATGGADAEQPFDIDVIDDFGPQDASLAVVNLTLVDSGGGGFVTAWPAGTEQPGTSNLNVDAAGQTRAGMAIVPIGADGEITVASSTTGDLLVDVLGYFGEQSGLNGLEPADRVLDSRPIGRVAADSTTSVGVTAGSEVPDSAEFVLVNVTAVDASAPGFVSVWPGGGDQPDASNLNYPAGGTIANTVLVPLGDDGTIDVYTAAEIDLLVDVIGHL